MNTSTENKSLILSGLIDGYIEKKSLDPSLRSLPPTVIGGGIGGIGTLLYNLLNDKKIDKDLLRNSLIGSGLGFGSSLIFPGAGLSNKSGDE